MTRMCVWEKEREICVLIVCVHFVGIIFIKSSNAEVNASHGISRQNGEMSLSQSQ